MITWLLALLLPLPIPAQFVVFAAGAVGAVYVGRRYLHQHPTESADPLLNDRTSRLIGRQVTVVEAIAGGEGKVKVGDSVWLAMGPDAPVGQRVTIIGADGNRLRVSAE